jgi:hypothetical protein
MKVILVITIQWNQVQDIMDHLHHLRLHHLRSLEDLPTIMEGTTIIKTTIEETIEITTRIILIPREAAIIEETMLKGEMIYIVNLLIILLVVGILMGIMDISQDMDLTQDLMRDKTTDLHLNQTTEMTDLMMHQYTTKITSILEDRRSLLHPSFQEESLILQVIREQK